MIGVFKPCFNIYERLLTKKYPILQLLVLALIQDFLCVFTDITFLGSHSHGNGPFVSVGVVIISVLDYPKSLPIISIVKRYEPVIGNKPQTQETGLQPKMNELRVLLSKLGQSDQIKSYLSKINDSLVLIKRCVVIIVFLAPLAVFLTEYLGLPSVFTLIGTDTRTFKA